MNSGPLPVVEGPDKPFWEGLREREVRVQRCGQCGAYRFPAARVCSHCRSGSFAWVAVAPKGIVETWCVFHQRYFPDLEVPYTVIQVRLDCGVRLFSNPVGIPADALSIGMSVEGVFENVTPDITLLKFGRAGGVPHEGHGRP